MAFASASRGAELHGDPPDHGRADGGGLVDQELEPLALLVGAREPLVGVGALDFRRAQVHGPSHAKSVAA